MENKFYYRECKDFLHNPKIWCSPEEWDHIPEAGKDDDVIKVEQIQLQCEDKYYTPYVGDWMDGINSYLVTVGDSDYEKGSDDYIENAYDFVVVVKKDKK